MNGTGHSFMIRKIWHWRYELFLWKKESQAEEVNPERLKEELADVLTYSLLLAEKHHLDIFDIVLEKIRKNGEKYPVEKAKGTAKKYTEL